MSLATIISITALIGSACSFITVWRRDKKIGTIAAYQDLQKTIMFLLEYQKGEIETFVTDRDTEEYKTISSCLAQIEIFAGGMKGKVYDFKTFYAVGHGCLDGSLRDSIEALIEMKNSTPYGSFYNNTKWLLNRMDKETMRKR